MSLILNTLSLCELLMGHPSKDVTHHSMSKIADLIGRSAVTPGGLAGSDCQQQKQTMSLCAVGRWCEEVRESTTQHQYIPSACPAHSALSLSLGDGESIPYSLVSQFCPGHPNSSQEVDKGLIFLTRSDL